jgi:hypothetical protein
METEDRPKDHVYNNPDENSSGDSLSDWVDENILPGQPQTGQRKTEASGEIDSSAEEALGPEIYDYGDGGGPDASSSGLRNESSGASTDDSDTDTGAGVGSTDRE